MAVSIDSIIEELKKQTEQRKLREVEKSALGKKRKQQFADVEAERQKQEQRQRQLQSTYFLNQRERQAAFSNLKKELEQLQVLVAEAGTTEAELLLADIDDVLLDTLDRDDHFDINSLKRASTYPRFTSTFSQPVSQPAPVSVTPRPEMEPVAEPRGLSMIFGGKGKYERARASAELAHQGAVQKWEAESAEVPLRQLKQIQEHQQKESDRQDKLNAERRKYDHERAVFEAEVKKYNEAIDAFRADYERGVESAVANYMNVVFARSLYPMNLPLNINHEYHDATREVRVKVTFPDPSVLPTVKGYRYVKTKDDIQEIPVTQKEAKDRYAGMVQKLSLRLIHEIWESDHPRHVQTISLSGWVDHVDPATGQDTSTQVIAVAVDRDTFEGIDLRRATPAESLKYLGAVVSSNPSGYVGIVDQYGVRGR